MSASRPMHSPLITTKFIFIIVILTYREIVVLFDMKYNGLYFTRNQENVVNIPKYDEKNLVCLGSFPNVDYIFHFRNLGLLKYKLK